ncbi:MAG: CAP domain-containing protein, partial [Clostridiales bacterium]|nr:CAP domain-containing protein [Clostridiales bacterium]
MVRKTTGKITTTVTALLLAVFLFAGQVFAKEIIYVDIEGTYDQETAREMLDLVNDFRLSDEAYYLNMDNTTTTSYVGELGELTYDYNLEGVAMQRAYEIALNFRHQCPDGGSIYQIEYNGVHTSGENIACGSGTKMDTYEKAFLAFKEDDKDYEGQGHRRNMLNPSWEAVGMAHIVVGNVHYWVQEFSGSESDNNDYVEPVMETRTITDIPWDIDGHTPVVFLEKGTTGNYYSAYYGQTKDLPAVNVWYTANPDQAMKSNVKVNGVTYTFITGYLYGGPVPDDRYSISWESEDDTIVTTDGSTYTVVGIGLCKLTCSVSIGDEVLTSEMYVNAKKMPLSNDAVTITYDAGPYEYTGSPIKPEVSVMYGDLPLTDGVDYKVQYS